MDHLSDITTNGDDIIYSVASPGSGQRHIYAKGGDDVIHLGFAEISRFSHGHHVRGDRTDELAREGSDTFSFTDLNNVRDVVVGRIDDFDLSRDEIQIEGEALDLFNLPDNVRIVAFNGLHNDPGQSPQQWILIETDAGGALFYALEGARVDQNGDGGANGGAQEDHFISRQTDLPPFAEMQDVAFFDQVNVVPKGATPHGGIFLNDLDRYFSPIETDHFAATTIITGSALGDAIAAGLNDDTVSAGQGDDQVWGGSGNDMITGGAGDDSLYGGSGNDELWGNGGNEMLSGDNGDDLLIGGRGRDTMKGGDGSDKLGGSLGKDILLGGAGDDRLFGRLGADTLSGGDGDDKLNGGRQNDRLVGGDGADQFIFTGIYGHDVVVDFEPGIDKLVFDGPAVITTLATATLVTTDGGAIVLANITDGDFVLDDLITG